ncbi:hypothetical protein [Chryseobacterium oranimense]|uniref:tetratricopeptide repeat protein n=1 Tax=Chryseobacterium oranimense TaxID=421058 RepID=UPI0031CF91A7
MKLNIYIFFFITLISGVPKNSEEKIESLLKSSLESFIEIKFNESLKKSIEAVNLSEKNNYSRGKTVGSIYIAKVLLEVGLYKEALEYLEKAEENPFFNTVIDFKVETARLRGRAYGNLKMYQLATKEFQEQLHYSYQIKDKNKRSFSLIWAHQNLSDIFGWQNKKDSLRKHLISQENILKTLDEKEAYHSLYTTYAQRADEYIADNDVLIAKTYLEKATQLINKYHVLNHHDVLKIYGNLEDKKGNKKKAIEYYEKALQNSIKIEDDDATRSLYKLLTDYYTQNTSDTKKTLEYWHKYQQINDLIEFKNTKATELIIDQIVKKKNKELNESSINYTYFIAGITTISFSIIFFFYFRNKKQKLLLEESEGIIVEKKMLTEELTEKINDQKINQILELAKKNNSEFIILFHEMYPEFIEKLKKRDPNIRSTEIMFFAMAYLNFSTKEIAEYSFVTIRAVQIRKSRLRKKYDIPSDKDFNIWVRNM